MRTRYNTDRSGNIHRIIKKIPQLHRFSSLGGTPVGLLDQSGLLVWYPRGTSERKYVFDFADLEVVFGTQLGLILLENTSGGDRNRTAAIQ